MTANLIFCTHPEVRIDPLVPVARWGLSDVGRERMAQFVDAPLLRKVQRVVCSDETKALEAAALAAASLGIAIEVRPELGENDRTSTGFVPPAEFELLADAFFANPDESVEGWETASAAQARVVAATSDLLDDSDVFNEFSDTLVVAHGAVGTLLYCHLAGKPISRSFDQPHQGCYFSVAKPSGFPNHHWRSITAT